MKQRRKILLKLEASFQQMAEALEESLDLSDEDAGWLAERMKGVMETFQDTTSKSHMASQRLANLNYESNEPEREDN